MWRGRGVRVKIKIRSLLTSTLDEDISFTLRAFYPRNIATNIQWIGCWKGRSNAREDKIPTSLKTKPKEDLHYVF